MRHLKTSIGIAAAALMAGAFFNSNEALAENWTGFLKTPARSSYVERAVQPPLSLKWRFETKGPIYSSPAVFEGKVFVGSHDKNLYAIDAETGKPAWSFATDGEVLSSPAVEAGKVYFGSKDGFVYAVEAATGKLAWKHQTDGKILTSPLVSEGLAFIASNDLYLYALSASDGKRVWRMKLPDYEKYSAVYASPA